MPIKFWIISLFLLTTSCVTLHKNETAVHLLRLQPGQEIKTELMAYARNRNLKAASIVSAVGSLQYANLRFANQNQSKSLKGPFEIVSLSGMIDRTGSHIHMAISDETGKTIGGHLSDGNVVFTTAEISILEYPHYEFTRELDPQSGYKELVIKNK